MVFSSISGKKEKILSSKIFVSIRISHHHNMKLMPINLAVERFLTQIYNCFGSQLRERFSEKNKGSLQKKGKGGGSFEDRIV